jgi:hypothetical protein
VDELGDGVDDTTIRLYAVQEHRLIVTSDDDFVQMPADSHSGVLYVPDQSLPPHELYRRFKASASGSSPEAVHHVIQRVVDAFPNREAMETVTHITTDWL